jgi:hypothetical protein
VTTYDAELEAARAAHDLAVAGPRAAIIAAAAERDATLRIADEIRDSAWTIYKLAVAEPHTAMQAAWGTFYPLTLKAARASAWRGPIGGP